jgi:hypothetical protein
VNENYLTVNVANSEDDPKSHLNIAKELIALRQNDAVKLGSFVLPPELNTSPDTLVFFRFDSISKVPPFFNDGSVISIQYCHFARSFVSR